VSSNEPVRISQTTSAEQFGHVISGSIILWRHADDAMLKQ